MDQPAADPAALDSALLQREAARLGFELSAAEMAAFERYAAELVAANQRFNLTRLAQPDEIAIQLILDSLMGLRALPASWLARDSALRCADIGTGAGLPGLALAILRPGWQVTLVDSVGKKVGFVKEAIQSLGLENASAVHARAEDFARQAAQRGVYDLALARAVAPLATLAEYCLPLLRRGGRLVAYKGAEPGAELEDAAAALTLLGGRLHEVRPYTLPGMSATRHLVVLEQLRLAPAAYPRRAPLPREAPLGGSSAGD